jgi:O-antigen/teichoic acid export membrane protein
VNVAEGGVRVISKAPAMDTDNKTRASRRASSLVFAQSVISKVSIVAINAATGIITARMLNPVGRGELAALILWPVFLAGVSTLGLPSAQVFYLRRNPEKESSLVASALILSTLLGAVAAMVGWFGIPYWLREHSPHIVRAAQFFVLSTPICSLILVGRAAWEAKARFGSSNLSLLLTPVLTLIALLTLAFRNQLSPESAACAYIFSGIAPAVWMVISLQRLYRPTIQAASQSCRKLMSYGLRSYGTDLCGTLALYTDQALVVALLQPGAMGIYAVVLSLSRVLNVVHSSVVMMIFPRAVTLPKHELLEFTGRAARLSTICTLVLGLSVIATGPLLLNVMYGRDYGSGAPLLKILVAEVVLAGLTQVLIQGIMAAERPGIATAIQMVGLILSIPLFLVLIPKLGLTGAGLALLASTVMRFMLSLASFPLFLKVRPPRCWIGLRDLAEIMERFAALLCRRDDYLASPLPLEK